MPNFEKYQIGDKVRWTDPSQNRWNEGIITKKCQNGQMIMRTIRQKLDAKRSPNFQWHDSGFSLISRYLPPPLNTSTPILAKNGKWMEVKITKL